MFWHIAKLRYSDDSESGTRATFERLLQSLRHDVSSVRQVLVTDAVGEPGVIGFLIVFDSQEDFDEYLKHPAHERVQDMASELLVEVVRLNLWTKETLAIKQ